MESAPAIEAFLRRLENWLNDTDLENVGLAIEIRNHGGKGAPQVVDLDLKPARSGAAALSIGICAWPENEVEYYLSIGAGREILTTAMQDRLNADRVLAICEAVAAGGLREQRLTLAGRIIGHRAAVRYGHTGIYAQRAGLAGLGLDRIAAALGLARLAEIGYPAWKVL